MLQPKGVRGAARGLPRVGVLCLAERVERIDARRPAGREPAGEQADGEQHRRDDPERQGVGRRDPEQHALDEARRRGGAQRSPSGDDRRARIRRW